MATKEEELTNILYEEMSVGVEEGESRQVEFMLFLKDRRVKLYIYKVRIIGDKIYCYLR